VRVRTTDGPLRSGPSPDALEEVRGGVLEVRASGSTVRAGGDRASRVIVEATEPGRLVVGSRTVRGTLEISARADSLFVVNVVPLEDYLRGVVPGEIGRRPESEREAVAAQAIAARTYTVKRLEQYRSLPFDVFASVQDQVYEGLAGEHATADAAILETRGLVLESSRGLLEAYYSSTCGGYRGDIVTVWPHREPDEPLRGGPDGPEGDAWCRASRHFAWSESWSGSRLSSLVRAELPAVLGLPAGSVRGDLVDLRVTRRDASGRAGEILYETTQGTWRVPGDKNRWILRRPDGGILRSTRVTLDVQRGGGRVTAVRAEGGGNGHGVGLCQTGALGRARAGETFREILDAYYPGARVRPLSGSDLPPGRVGAF